MSKKNVLPPNVIGQTRGVFEIEVVDIIWLKGSKGVKSTESKKHNICNTDILKFIWWGENQHIAKQCEFSQIKKKIEKVILKYNICTNIKLFYDYLRNCEPIVVEISSKISNIQIGTVFTKIPEKFMQVYVTSSLTCESKYQIFSTRNKILGDIVLHLRMQFYESVSIDCIGLCTNFSPNSITSTNDEGTVNSHRPNANQSYETFDFEIEKKSFRQSEGSNNNYSFRVMEYLTGQTMSYVGEQEALKEIHRTSPLNKCILDDLIHRTNFNKLTKNLCKISLPINQQIDSIRLKLKNIKLLPPGIREVNVESLLNTTFTVEYKISENILDNCKRVIRFYSDSYNDKEQRIGFNREVISCIKIISNEFNPLMYEHSEILFTIWWRKFGSKQPRCLGTSNFRFTNLLNVPNFEQSKKLQIQSCAGRIHVADLFCKFTLGINGVHFGPELKAKIDNTYYRNASVSKINTLFSYYSNLSCKQHNKLPEKKILSERNYIDKIKTIPNISNNTNKSTTSRPLENSNVPSANTQSTQSTDLQLKFNYNNEKDINQLKSVSNKKCGSFRLLQGLLYVGSIKNLPPINNGGYFLVCRAFWKEDTTSTEFVQCDNFNFLEIFPVINDEKFLERTRNNHLKLEIWQKTVETSEHLIGIVRLPLHQFFIAFRDSELTNHLCRAKNPVISMDGWAPIVGPLSGTTCGQLQTILAVGTEEQLEDLKIKRGISSESVYIKSTNSVPKLKQNIQQQSNCTANVETNINSTFKPTDSSAISIGKPTIISNLLNNLQQTLSLNESSSNPNPEQKISSVHTSHVNNHDPQTVNFTSDLLNVLQQALDVPLPSTSNCLTGLISSITNNTILKSNICKILLEIESALHLSRNPFKLINKKSGSQKRNTNKDKQNLRFPPNEEPSAYVTFQAVEGYGPMIKSHEGMVYATNIIEKCSNPSWAKSFEIAVPIDMLINDEKHFVLKVWRKAVTYLSLNRLIPTPMEDSIIGFAAIDLTVLMARMPCISGWFNIVDFNGRINGQLKINVKPLENIMKFKNSKNCSPKHPINCFVTSTPFVADIDSKESQTNTLSLTSTTLNLDLNRQTSLPTSNGGISDLKNTILSRAIKRKFAELEEITQRLRVRLLDVTGESELGSGDYNTFNDIDDDAQLDEFEQDLNTACTEDNNENLKSCEIEYFNSQAIASSKNVADISKGYKHDVSSRTYVTEEEIQSSSSSNERIQMISNFLQRTEINTNNDFKRSEDGIEDKEYSGNNV